jgi:hypothetical protein
MQPFQPTQEAKQQHANKIPDIFKSLNTQLANSNVGAASLSYISNT